MRSPVTLFLGFVLLGTSPALAATGSGPNLYLQEFSVSVGSAGWQNSVSANPGDELWFQLIVHNTNVPSTAEHLTVKLDLPQEADGSLTVTANVSSETPTTVPGSTNNVGANVSVLIPSGARLSYRSNSLRLTWDVDGDGIKDYEGSPWPAGDATLTSSGIDFGNLQGCNEYVMQLLFAADVIGLSPPKLTLDKKVRFGGSEVESIPKETHLFNPGEKITYRLFASNSWEQEAKKVEIKDSLPPYLKWIEGDGAYDPGANRINFDLGTMKAGESKTLGYVAQVVDSVPEGQHSQDNIAKIYEEGEERDQGRAFIWVSSGPKEGEILAVAAELPTTGVGRGYLFKVMVLSAAGVALGLGILFRRFRLAKFKYYKSDYWR